MFYAMIESFFSAIFVWPLKGLITFSVLKRANWEKIQSFSQIHSCCCMFGNNFGIPYFCWKTASPIIQLSCRKKQRFQYCFWDIYESLKDPYLKSPSSVNDWKSISERFEEVWNFPHVVGTIDGKHMRIECHKLSGTLYHNYKGFLVWSY